MRPNDPAANAHVLLRPYLRRHIGMMSAPHPRTMKHNPFVRIAPIALVGALGLLTCFIGACISESEGIDGDEAPITGYGYGYGSSGYGSSGHGYGYGTSGYGSSGYSSYGHGWGYGHTSSSGFGGY
jgi:hypothetical protein